MSRHRQVILVKLFTILGLIVWLYAETTQGAIDHGSHLGRLTLAALFGMIFFVLIGRALSLASGFVRAGEAEQQMVEYERQMEFMGMLPERIDWMGEDRDGNHVVTIQRRNGEMAQITVPEGYTPAEDNGELLVRLACPDLEGMGVTPMFFGIGDHGDGGGDGEDMA